ncbi:AcrR family transcriptional regulator [Lipingzhangella halophila]|uniref:AcrR family transcriptional regulator n=1 Tax=Lipingzhangella halophila TaxID=1783352 RepID=A0A7W7W5L2_9ACTN|nr:TetR/AcrR family transcriptional regulator [Lipingzhangella halophila]MBB4933974.1 AcrR family transcriptional regulator [Lipingzhangella halophila]
MGKAVPPDTGESAKGMRADARRNRDRVLETAIEVFATEGLSVPVHEIARRAGVGTGTVSRHFPTKEALYEAIVLRRVERIMERAAPLAESDDPGAAFFEYLAVLVEEGAVNRGLAEALAGVDFDMDGAAKRAGYDIGDLERRLLVRAQQAGAVRPEVEAADVKGLIVGCLARERDGADPDARGRMIRVVSDGLRAPQ